MRDFIPAIGPALVLWTLPLAPLLFCGIVDLVEFVGRSVRREMPERITAGELAA